MTCKECEKPTHIECIIKEIRKKKEELKKIKKRIKKMIQHETDLKCPVCKGPFMYKDKNGNEKPLKKYSHLQGLIYHPTCLTMIKNKDTKKR